MKDLRVLLVEDDPLIRMAAEDQLADCGCQVHGVRDAEQALEALRSQSFDLLFTDARLPGLSGPQLIVQALAEWPGLRVVLASGYGDLGALGLGAGKVITLPKPYTQDGITRALSEAMAPRA